MRWFLARLFDGPVIGWSTRKQAIEFRNTSKISAKDAPTIEVIPLFEVVTLLRDWHDMLPGMEKTLTPGERAIHKSCMQDLIDRLNTIRNGG